MTVNCFINRPENQPFGCLKYDDAVKNISNKSAAGKLALKHYNNHKFTQSGKSPKLSSSNFSSSNLSSSNLSSSQLSGMKKEAAAGAFIGTAASIKSAFDAATKGGNNFCLNPGEAAKNAGMNFGKNMLNVVGGLGDLVFDNIPGNQNPLDNLQNQLTQVNQEYEKTFKTFTQKFASVQVDFNNNVVQAFQDVADYSTKNTAFFFEMLSEKEQIDRIYIIFLFIYIFVILVYIFME
jgi:hypothetical protein